MRNARAWLGALGLVLLLAGEGRAQAEERCPVPEGGSPALGGADPEARLAFLRATLEDQSRRAKLWNWGWAAAGTAIAGGGLTIAALQHDRDQQLEWIVADAPALWYPLMAVVNPPEVIADHRALEDLLRETAGTKGRMDACLLVARAEYLVASAADDEKARVNWFQHTLALAASAGIGLVIALALGDPAGGIVNGVGSVLVSEANLWTAPTGAYDALGRYKQGELHAMTAMPRMLGLWVPITW